MTETKSYKPIYWVLALVALLALVAWVYAGTKKSNQEVRQAAASGTGLGTAYDATTGAVVPAGATPGALGTTGTPPSIPANGNSANGSAGGTTAGVNPQANPAPGPVAAGTATPPANIDR